MKRRKKSDIIVVGAGASGLMAAIQAARKGASVLVLEHKETAGKKILKTGNGKCNYTNRLQPKDAYRGTHPEFARGILKQFSVDDTIHFFQEIGIYPKEKNGYLYPASQQASAVQEALLEEIRRLGIPILTDVGIRKIEKKQQGFFLDVKGETDYQCQCCILACGGMADPKSGSDGSGFYYCRPLGHTVIEPQPALVPLLCNAPFLKEMSGVRMDATVQILGQTEHGNLLLAEDTGELQLTEYGISGIPTFQVSRYAQMALQSGKKVIAQLDLFPALSEESLKQELFDRFTHFSDTRSNLGCISGLLPKKVAQVLLKKAGLKSEQTAKVLSEKQLYHLCRTIKSLQMPVTATKGFAMAQTTAGGIDTKEITPQMESRLVSGLFFAGEMVDIDGKCGGYNLQWAWSSGTIAGIYAAKKAQNSIRKEKRS
ncbi:MAG: NAD(P)/FAD-dependent oxidoreductase [Lachnospiraceae bacterium]